MKIHFISGLPRSGKTLLAALLRQNPRFRAGMTSPALTILSAVEGATSRAKEGAVLLTDEQKLALRRSVFTALYPEDDVVVFDTNTLWTAKLPLLTLLFPDAKIIACVRNVSWVMDSLERLYRSSPLELSGLYGFKPNTTVYSRTSKLADSGGMVGWALDALREAYYGTHRDAMWMIEYTDLVTKPNATLNALYEVLDEKRFAHDFGNVDFDADNYDALLGAPGLHRVRREVKYTPRSTILPPDVYDRFRNDAFWERTKLPVQDRREVA